jgi:fructokinase
MKLLGGIEAGGTKFVCAISESGQDGQILSEARFPTTEPNETIHKAKIFFHEQSKKLGPLAALGIASFGPLDPKLDSETYGYITSTPKPGWANFDFVGSIREEFELPIGFDTDVNGAVLGEWRWGAGRGLDSLVYLTIGTGIGGGAITNGRIVHGLLHTEMGHMQIPHDTDRDPFPGICPYHGDCWEGLACGPSIEKRWGQRADTLPVDHPAWKIEADYIALALMNLMLVLSPERIILGGGVMSQKQLFPQIRVRVLGLLNGYLKSKLILSGIDSMIVPPGLGNQSGVKGAIALAELAAES